MGDNPQTAAGGARTAPPAAPLSAPRPQRLRRRRTKHYDMQAESRALNGLDAVSCTRPGRYGNPWIPGPLGEARFRHANGGGRFFARSMSQREAVALFKVRLATILRADPGFLEPLRGKNLACFCALDQPHCHVDVLLELANPGLGWSAQPSQLRTLNLREAGMDVAAGLAVGCGSETDSK